MDNLNEKSQLEQTSLEEKNSAPWSLIVFIIIIIIAIGVAWQYTGKKEDPVTIKQTPPVVETVVEKVKEEAPQQEVVEPVVETPIEEAVEEPPEVVKIPLPTLDDSDQWLKVKLPEITWRKELLKLVIDDDMIRRFVVFTDNFAQGILAYEHSPFILPKNKFSPGTSTDNNQGQTTQNTWQWNEESSKRFTQYVELLRSMDTESLVSWYFEVKPLIDEAYSELGYDDDFTVTLQDAITRVLDMELPKSEKTLTRPSVMYHYANPNLESLPDSDKLLLRIGKDNLLVMKSVLLEIHEKLAQRVNGVE